MATFEEAMAERRRKKKEDEPGAIVESDGTFEEALKARKDAMEMVTDAEQRKALQAVNIDTKPEPTLWESISEAVTGAKRTTPEVEATAEVLSPGALNIDRKFDKNIKVAAGLLLSGDEEVQKQIIKSHAPETVFTTDDKGNVFGVYKGQKFILNKPGFSFADAQRAIIDMAAFYPAATFTNIGKGLLQRVAIGGLTAGLTEKGLEEARESLGAEERPTGALPAAGIAAVAELPVPLLGAAGRQVKRVAGAAAARAGARELSRKISRIGAVVDEELLKNLTEAEAVSEAIGIGLLPTQATGTASDEILQRVLTEQPASSKTILKFIKKQDEESAQAVGDFLTKIAPSSSLVEGPAKFKQAAKKAIDDLIVKRREHTQTTYKNLFKDPPDVDVNTVVDLIERKKVKFPEKGRVSNALNKALLLIRGKKKAAEIFVSPAQRRKITSFDDVPLDVLHNSKMELDDLIEGVGEKAVSPTAKRELLDVKEKLLEVMESPDFGGDPAYGAVREKFAELSIPISRLQDSIVGRASKLKDADLRKMSNIIFNPAESNPQTVKAIKNVIDKSDKDAFPMLLRSFLEERVSNISKRAKNAPNDFSVALFKNAKQRDMVHSVLDSNAKQNAKWLERALDLAARGRGTGSDTAAKAQLINKLSGTVFAPVIGIIAPAVTLGSVGATLSGARLLSSSLKKSTLDRRMRILSDVLVNEKWSKDMARIRKLNPETPAAMRAFAQLLNNAEKEAPQELNPE